MRYRKPGALLAFALTAIVALTGCSGINSIDATQSMASSTDCVAVADAIADAEKALGDAETSAKAAKPNTPAEAKAKQDVDTARALIGALQKRANDCSASAPQSAKQADGVQSLPSNGQKVGVLDPNGSKTGTPRTNVAWVTDLPNGTPSADTVSAGAPTSILGCEGYLAGWESLVECVEETGATWYAEAIDVRKGKTGFGWDDIEKWASARNKDGRLVEARVIEVFGHAVSDDEARRRAAEIVGGAEVAAGLPIVRRGKEFMNTWTPDGRNLEDYLFSPEEHHAVRVSLAPLKLNDKGQIVGLHINTPSGVFVDCANVWWLPLAVNTASGEPPAPPSKPGSGTPPPTSGGGTPPPPAPGGDTPPPPTPGGNTPPPPAPPTPAPPAKNPALDPAPQGAAGNGGGVNEDSGPGVFIQPQEMKQPPAAPRVNPDPPAAATAPAPPAPVPPALEIPPIPVPEPEAPTPDDPATGCVPAPGEDDC